MNLFLCNMSMREEELTAREAAAHILELAAEIQKETAKLRPLIKHARIIT